MNRGIVMEISSQNIIVMTPDGQFKKVPRRNRSCQIGEEIQFSASGNRWNVTRLSFASALTAAVLFCIIFFSGMGGIGQVVVAYVTVDINPSIEFGIDGQEKVVEVRGLNEDGIKLLETLDEIEGKTIEKVTEALMEQVEQQGYLSRGEGDILITSTVVQEETALNENRIIQKLEDKVKTVVKKNHPDNVQNIHIAKLSAPEEVREEAIKKGISTGKLAVNLIANDWIENNEEYPMDPIPLEKFENHSIHEITEQIGGLGKLISPQAPVTKEKLKNLLKAKKNAKGKAGKGKKNNNPEDDRFDSEEDESNLLHNDLPQIGPGEDRLNEREKDDKGDDHQESKNNKNTDKDKRKDKDRPGNSKDNSKGDPKRGIKEIPVLPEFDVNIDDDLIEEDHIEDGNAEEQESKHEEKKRDRQGKIKDKPKDEIKDKVQERLKEKKDQIEHSRQETGDKRRRDGSKESSYAKPEIVNIMELLRNNSYRRFPSGMEPYK